MQKLLVTVLRNYLCVAMQLGEISRGTRTLYVRTSNAFIITNANSYFITLSVCCREHQHYQHPLRLEY